MERGAPDIDGSFVPGEAAPSAGRGRPRKEPTLVVCVRITESEYDACCRRAGLARVPVRSVMRRAISEYIGRR